MNATPPEPRRCPAAYILAGGRSSRFGSDKARALLRGSPLIRRIAEMLESRGHQVVVVARKSEQYADLGLHTIADIEPDLGPVGGLETAVAHRLRSWGEGWALIFSCDLLNPTPAMLTVLESHGVRAPEAEAVAFMENGWQPFPGLYHTRLLARLRAGSIRSMKRLLTGPGIVGVEAPADLCQANTPAALREFEWREEEL